MRDLLNNKNNGNPSSFDGKFGSTALKYESRLVDNSGNFVNFAFYAPDIAPFTNRNSLSVFNASNLTPFLNSQGQVEFPEEISNLNGDSLASSRGFIVTFEPDNVTKVPEPAATASLLGFGIVSTVLLRKRKKRPETSLSK
ncbi:hypothetical protein DP113_15110 [Brasilonema octagenarum UFV-E1]|nr:hypothetical protein DP113_15110 [Brasilonema octagenarum UFV-E1]